MIEVSHPKARGRLAKQVEETLTRGGRITSLSGASAAAAMNWCHLQGRAYDLSYQPGGGWGLELRPEFDRKTPNEEDVRR